VERTAEALAGNIAALGHRCTLITETPACAEEPAAPYDVVRRPALRERVRLVRESSLVHAIGASVALYPIARLCGKPFMWTHTGYQVSCVDGLGWAYGEPAPMSPAKSLLFHLKRRGPGFFARETIKLGIRRYVSRRVDLNTAQTGWVARRQPIKDQVVACTPYPVREFLEASDNSRREYDFMFVGRFVLEKGAEDLLRAFHLLVSEDRYSEMTLALVGDGPAGPGLKRLVTSLGMSRNVSFLGVRYGKDLVNTVSLARIGVVPSVWEEPLGGVALEFLAAGKNLIVSARGGHAECAPEACLMFDNGDHEGLYRRMREMLEDGALAERQRRHADEYITHFEETALTKKYLELYRYIEGKLRGRRREGTALGKNEQGMFLPGECTAGGPA